MNKTLSKILKKFYNLIILFSLFAILNLTLLNLDAQHLLKNSLNNTYNYANDSVQELVDEKIILTCENYESYNEANTADLNISLPDLADICTDLTNNKIKPSQAFLAISLSQADDTNLKDLSTQDPIFKFIPDLNKSKEKLILILFLVILLFLLLQFTIFNKVLNFIHNLSKLILKTGILMIIPYLLIKLILLIRNPDTSQILLNAVLGVNAPLDIYSLIDMIALTIISIFSINYIIISITFISFGGFSAFLFKPINSEEDIRHNKSLLSSEEKEKIRDDLGLNKEKLKETIATPSIDSDTKPNQSTNEKKDKNQPKDTNDSDNPKIAKDLNKKKNNNKPPHQKQK